MEESKVASKLRALSVGEAHRSQTARLGDVLEEIETALKAGVKRSAILKILQESGFSLNMNGFQTALHRLRSKRDKAGGKGGSAVVVRATTAIAGAGVANRPADPPPVAAPQARKRLELAPSPKRTFDWDPLERPVFEFIDKEEDSKNSS
jgi:hypothetical protein